jgi:hypothetical protein
MALPEDTSEDAAAILSSAWRRLSCLIASSRPRSPPSLTIVRLIRCWGHEISRTAGGNPNARRGFALCWWAGPLENVRTGSISAFKRGRDEVCSSPRSCPTLSYCHEFLSGLQYSPAPALMPTRWRRVSAGGYRMRLPATKVRAHAIKLAIPGRFGQSATL